ncbi:MAG: hypothetical protein R3185_08540, partial [Candidatus Thermoplasmatota archaeon]|nr:hypothetical protein [Candidatus Thermoplasmatota archaeon]
MVSGSSLLRVELTGEITVLHSGRDAFFRATAWNPSTPLAWVEVALQRDGQALLGTIWRHNGSEQDTLEQEDNIQLYGRNNPGRALLNTIAFAPNGSFSLMAGRDGGGSSILTWASHRTACHQHEGQEACHDHRWQYLPTDKRDGPITCITWHPTERFALAVGLGADTLGFAGTRLYVPVLHHGPDLFGCTYHPDGTYALAVGEGGALVQVFASQQPLAGVVDPAPGALTPPGQEAPFLIGVLHRGGAGIANVTARVAGTDQAVTATPEGPWWQAKVNTTQLKDGRHLLSITVNAAQGSFTFTHPFLVNNQRFTPPRPTLLEPDGLEGSGTDADGTFTLRWEPVDAPVVYEVREERVEGPVNATRTLQAGGADNLTIQVGEDGTYLYKVRSKNAFNTSAWSAGTIVNVVLDSDGDGVPDSRDPRPYVTDTWGDQDGDGVRDDVEYRQCSDPEDPESTPTTDDDGDGLRNGEECLQGTDPRDPNDPGRADPGDGGDGPVDEDPGKESPGPG